LKNKKVDVLWDTVYIKMLTMYQEYERCAELTASHLNSLCINSQKNNTTLTITIH